MKNFLYFYPNINIYTHVCYVYTHTHTYRERGRERDGLCPLQYRSQNNMNNYPLQSLNLYKTTACSLLALLAWLVVYSFKLGGATPYNSSYNRMKESIWKILFDELNIDTLASLLRLNSLVLSAKYRRK